MRYTGIAVVLAVLVAGGVFLLSSEYQKGTPGFELSAGAAFDAATAASSSPTVPSTGENRYIIAHYGTSFIYPAGWDAKQVKTGNRTVVTIAPKTGGGVEGVQVSITPVGESMPIITPARIHQDLPNLDIENPTHVSVDGQDILVFTSNNASYGGKEGWFVHSGALYQISALPGSANAFTALVSSLHF